MNYYDKINWKNRSEGKTTKISAERLNHMDNQIFNNANAIGNVEKIADIGDGTLCGAAETLKETAEKLNQSLNSEPIQPTASSFVSILYGGYKKVGNIVTLSIELKVVKSFINGDTLLYGLPTPKGTSAPLRIMNNANANFYDGYIRSNGDLIFRTANVPTVGQNISIAVSYIH